MKMFADDTKVYGKKLRKIIIVACYKQIYKVWSVIRTLANVFQSI